MCLLGHDIWSPNKQSFWWIITLYLHGISVLCISGGSTDSTDLTCYEYQMSWLHMFYFTHAGQFQFKLPRHMYISLPYIENNSSSEKGGGRRRCPVREEGPNVACPAFADLQLEQKPAHTPCWSKIKCKGSLFLLHAGFETHYISESISKLCRKHIQ